MKITTDSLSFDATMGAIAYLTVLIVIGGVCLVVEMRRADKRDERIAWLEDRWDEAFGGPEPVVYTVDPRPKVDLVKHTDTVESHVAIERWGHSLPPLLEQPRIEETLNRFQYAAGHVRGDQSPGGSGGEGPAVRFNEEESA